MKAENKEEDSLNPLFIVKKSNGRKRRGKKKSRSMPEEGGDAAGTTAPTSQPAEMAPPTDGVTSQVTSCETCGIQTRNPAQLAAHLTSKRHARRRRELRILAALSETAEGTAVAEREALAVRLARGDARLEAPTTPLKEADLPACITTRREGKIGHRRSYACQLCGVQLTSLFKVQEHLSSQRHRAVQEGRPPPVRQERPSSRRAKTKHAVKESWFW